MQFFDANARTFVDAFLAFDVSQLTRVSMITVTGNKREMENDRMKETKGKVCSILRRSQKIGNNSSEKRT